MTATSEKDLLASSSPGASLYDALGLGASATPGEIRKAYFKLSLKTHPDRCPDDPDATKRFQSLQKIYGVLSDPEKRKLYDETGITDADDPEAFGEDRCASLRAFYKKSFNEVTGDAIDKFKDEYQGSDEELGDVLAYYAEFEGDMDEVFRHVMLSEVEADADRFVKMVEDGLEDGRLAVRFDKYEAWRQKIGRVRKGKKKGKGKGATGKHKRHKAEGDGGDLAQAILAKRSRSSTGGGGFSDFAAKFGVVDDEDPLGDDAAFRAAQERLFKQKE
jgi:DnaJ homolog subfamily C member 9